MNKMIFETQRLYVAKWKTGNLKALYDLFNDVAIKEFILPKLTMEETKHIFEEQINSYEEHFSFGRYFIVEKCSNEFIGLLLFKEDEKQAGVEIGYSLKKEYWNKGYATEIVEEAVRWLFSEGTIENIYAITETDNVSSQRVLLKCNFAQEDDLLQDGKKMSLFVLKNK